ncbi:MAG: ABC-2 family transporter protein [Candidatus Paceibacterota bacterium]|jgi:ABC-2 type transport system permease protein
MKLYLSVIKFNWLKILAYPFEIIAFFAGRFIALGFLALFWYAIAMSSSGGIDFRPLIAYFFIAAAVREVTYGQDTKFGRYIQQLVNRGEINNHFIKPIKTVPYLFFSYAGETGLGMFYALATLIIGLVILPPMTWFNVLAFLIFIIFALIISLCFNVIVGLLSFYSPEANGFRNAFNHVNKILSGSLIPINLFPTGIKEILLLLPFPALIFSPAYVLQNQLGVAELLQLFLPALFWSIILIFITRYFWRRSVKTYEGVGV